MFLRLLHISIVLALLFQQCQSTVTCILFKMEQPYLSKHVCENRYDPKSNCKAHCQLLKVVQNQDKQQHQSKMPMKGESETEFVGIFQKHPVITIPFHPCRGVVSGLVKIPTIKDYIKRFIQPPEWRTCQ